MKLENGSRTIYNTMELKEKLENLLERYKVLSNIYGIWIHECSAPMNQICYEEEQNLISLKGLLDKVIKDLENILK